MKKYSLILASLLSCITATEVNGQTLVHGELLFVASDLYQTGAEGETAEPNRQQADMLFQSSRQACDEGKIAAALAWATRAVREDPNHADARRVLGYRRVGPTWAGNYAARRLERGETWHPRFGWIRPEEVSRWEAGERRLGRRWISAQQDARRHATIDDPWQVRTDHFLVETNHSLESAADLATRLEKLYQVWQQMFGGFYLDQPTLRKRFEGRETSGYHSKPFRVAYYRTREEYNRRLKRLQPRIGITLGIYFDATRSSHFFAGPEQDAGTIHHEVVHQFFHEARPAARNIGGLSNFWLVEGVACYFESLAEHDDSQIGRFYSLGTPTAGRLPAARQRRLVDGYYVSLAELSALGKSDLQRRTDIGRLYSQSAGLATFLIHARDGAYRPALVKLLQAIYAGRDTPTSLVELSGRSFAQLDEEYREFLKALP